MSTLMIVACKDAAVGTFMRPWFCRSKPEAVRLFGDVVNRSEGENQIAQHPDDYSLWYLAEFDENTGQIVGVSSPEKIVEASLLVKV